MQNISTVGISDGAAASTAAPALSVGEHALPVVMEPGADKDLLSFIGVHGDEVERTLRQAGAILFRGFTTQQQSDLERFTTMAGGPLMDYQDRATKRSQVKGKILTSTDTPRRYSIPMHNESSYAAIWPLRLVFHCVLPSESGGCTPLADSRKVFEQIDPEVREAFARRGVLYVRNFGVGPGMSWRDSFQVQTRQELEAYCGQAGIECEWVSEEHVRTRQRRRCDAVHPLTGEAVWFCHATILHISSLDPTLGETLLRQYGEANLPYNTYYGDGSPIDAATLEHIRGVYEANTVRFNWQSGDTLLLDSMLVAHARDPYQGERKILSLLAWPMTWAQIDAASAERAAKTGTAMQGQTPRDESTGSDDMTERDAYLDDLLLKTLAQVLEVSVVRMDDNFFELGGDSLTATRVIAKLRDETKIDLPLAAFFNVNYVQELADLVKQSARA